jgi:alpha-glucosidase
VWGCVFALAGCGAGTPTESPGVDGPGSDDRGASDAGAAIEDGPLPDVSTSVSAAAPDADGTPPSASCDFAALQNAKGGPLATSAYAVGDFGVTVTPGLGLRVTHAASPAGVAAESPAGEAFFVAARGTLAAEEHQGSFDLKETIAVTCTRPQVTSVVEGGGRLMLRGAFAGDADARCRALRFEVRMCAARPGHLVFEGRTSDPTFAALAVRVASPEREKVWGLGEQFPHDTLDLKGRRIPVIAQEGGIGRGHTPISQAVNAASKGSAGSEDSTYYAAPHVLTSGGRSFFLENTEVAFFDMTRRDRIDARVYAPTVRGRILAARTPLEQIERFTEYAGRMPPLPDWVSDGAIVALARPLDRSRTFVEKLRGRGAAIAGVWNQTWSGKVRTFVGEQVLWNWVQNPNTHPGWRDYVRWLDERGIKTLCYVNSMLREPPPDAGPVSRNLFQEALAGDHFVKDREGKPLFLPVTAFDVGLIDLSSEPARRFMKDVIKTEMLEKAGCSGWMADFAEALPFEAVLASGESAASYHNRYPVEWARINREAVEEAGMLGKVLVFNRSGHTRSPAYSLLLWEGDQLTTWDKYDGLVSALHGLIGGGFSGIALNHSDVGGYTSLSRFRLGYLRERELLHRWTEMAAFTAVLRTHEGNQPEEGNAQVYDDASIDHFARFTKVYRALKFYRSQLFAEAATKGWPVVRHLALHHPADADALSVDDQFLLGSDVLVAPIKNKCFTAPICPYDKDVYLPAGRWVHLWSGKVFGATQAGTRVQVKAPIGSPAVFYKEGSAVGATFVKNLRAEGITVPDPN